MHGQKIIKLWREEACGVGRVNEYNKSMTLNFYYINNNQ